MIKSRSDYVLTLLIPGRVWGGDVFHLQASKFAKNSQTKQAITLKLGDFSQIGISKI